MAQHNQFGQSPPNPSLAFLNVKHDNNCLTILTQDGADCTCKELDYEFHSSPQRFSASIALGRTARRKAAREAAKALRNAGRK